MQGRFETPALGFFKSKRRKILSTAALRTECERAQMESFIAHWKTDILI